MRNLLRKSHFGHILRKFSLNSPIIRLKFAQNLPQTDFPSRRLSFSDSLLEKMNALNSSKFSICSYFHLFGDYCYTQNHTSRGILLGVQLTFLG